VAVKKKDEPEAAFFPRLDAGAILYDGEKRFCTSFRQVLMEMMFC
jgi:hypothetical protein